MNPLRLLRELCGWSCPHRNYSFPLTPKQRRPLAARITGSYVVCLACGAELPYDWNQMKTLSTSEAERFSEKEHVNVQPATRHR